MTDCIVSANYTTDCILSRNSGCQSALMHREPDEEREGNYFSEGVVMSDRMKGIVSSVPIPSALTKMRKGAYLLKIINNNSFRKPHYRFFSLEVELWALRWVSPNKPVSKTCIFFSEVDKILPGFDSDYFRDRPYCNFGIEICGPLKLRILCSDTEEWKTWMTGLLYAQKKALEKKNASQSLAEDFLYREWNFLDTKKTKCLPSEAILQLFRASLITSEPFYVRGLLREFDETGLGVLEYPSFRRLLDRLIKRDCLSSYFHNYKTSKSETMSLRDFKRFLFEVQHNTDSVEVECQSAFSESIRDSFKNEKGLTELEFHYLMSSSFNSIMNPHMNTVYQNMERPLHEYWIASSHNTYLTGDQLAGKSAVGQYIDVLLKGCRCVELDCWDGPDGEPVIYHGFGGFIVSSRVSFRSVIIACRDYGFQRSPYPIILSLEMHCSPEQKVSAGKILISELGDKLWTQTEFPATPNNCRGKILVKGRVPPGWGQDIGACYKTIYEKYEEKYTIKEQEEGNEQDLAMEEAGYQVTGFQRHGSSEHRSKSKISKQDEGSPGGRLCFYRKSLSSKVYLDNSSCNNTDVISLESESSNIQKNNNRKAGLDLYYSCISLTGKKLQSFTDERKVMDICSMNESRFLSLSRTSGTELKRFQRSHLMRVYPSGTRVTSSNFNPITAWCHGVQIVALNWQASGMPSTINIGRFLQNGGSKSGYVLKPPELLQDNSSSEIEITLIVELLSAHELPICPSDSRYNSGLPYSEITEKMNNSFGTYVLVSIDGAEGDRAVFKSTVVSTNGLFVIWNHQNFTFRIKFPSIAMLLFEIKKNDSVRFYTVGAAAFPVPCIRQGIRWVPISDGYAGTSYCGLMVKIEIEKAQHIFSTVTPSR